MARNIKLGRLESDGMFAEKDWTKDPDVGIHLETATGGKSFFSTCSPRVVLYKVIGQTQLSDEWLIEEIESVGGTGSNSLNYGILDSDSLQDNMEYPDWFFPFGWAMDPSKVGTTYTVDLNNSAHDFLNQFILFSETVTIPEGKAWIPLFFEYNFSTAEVKGVSPRVVSENTYYCGTVGAAMGEAWSMVQQGRMLDRPRQLYNSTGSIGMTLRKPEDMGLRASAFGNIWQEDGWSEPNTNYTRRVVGVPDNSKYLPFPLTGRIEGGVTLLPPMAQLQSYTGSAGSGTTLTNWDSDRNYNDSWKYNNWDSWPPNGLDNIADSPSNAISSIMGFPVGFMLLEISYDSSSGAGISLGRDGYDPKIFAGHIVDNYPSISSKRSGIAAFETPGEKEWTVRYWENITASNTIHTLSSLGEPTYEAQVPWDDIDSDDEHSMLGYNPPATTADCNAPSGIGYCNYGTKFNIEDLFPGSGLTSATAHNYQAHFTTWIKVAASFTVTTCYHTDNYGYLYINDVLIAQGDWSSPGAYTYSFTSGWYKIDMVYYEGGGGDYAHLGFNINTVPEIVGGGGSIKSSTVFDSTIPRIVHAGFHWDPEATRNRANIITTNFTVPSGKRWIIYTQPHFDSTELPDTMTLHGHDIVEPKLNTVWPGGWYTYEAEWDGLLVDRDLCENVSILEFGCPDTCVSGDTLITTKEGQLEAKQIKKGMLVQVYDFETKSILFKEVKNRTLRKTKIWIQYTLETGKTIKCTLDHNFYRPERPENKIGYTDLKIGDSLYTLEKEKAIEEKIINIEIIKTKKQEKAYTFTIKDIPLYISGGIFSHNYETPGFDQDNHNGLPYSSGTTELSAICTVQSSPNGGTVKAFLGPKGITGSWGKLCIEMVYNNCAGLYTNKVSNSVGEINIGFSYLIFEIPDGADGLLQNWSDGEVVEPEVESSALYMSLDPVIGSSIVAKDYNAEGMFQQQHMNAHMPILRYFELVNLFKKPDKGYAPGSGGSGDAYAGTAGMRDYHAPTTWSSPNHHDWNNQTYAPQHPFAHGGNDDWQTWYGGPESTYRTIAGNPRGDWSPAQYEQAFTVPEGRNWICTIQPMRNLERNNNNDLGYFPNQSGAEMPICSITGGNPTTGCGMLFTAGGMYSQGHAAFTFGGSTSECPTIAGYYKQGILFRRRAIGGDANDWSDTVVLQGGALEGGFEYSWLKAKAAYQISSLDSDKNQGWSSTYGRTTYWYLVTTDYSGHQFKFERPFEFMFMIFDVPDEWPISEPYPDIPDDVMNAISYGCTNEFADNYASNATHSCTEDNYPGGCVEDFGGTMQTGANCCCYQTEEVLGCNDPTAENFFPGANTNDGSCTWNCSSEGLNSTENYWVYDGGWTEAERTAVYLCMTTEDYSNNTVLQHSGDHACGTPMGGAEGSNKWHLVSIEENQHVDFGVWSPFSHDGSTNLVNHIGYMTSSIYRAVCDATPCEDVGGGENCPDYCTGTNAWRDDYCNVTGELPANWECTGGQLHACTCNCYGAGNCHTLSSYDPGDQVCTGTTQSSETACVSNVCGAGSTANACGSDTRKKIYGVSCDQCTSACTTNCGVTSDCPFGCYGNNLCHDNCCEAGDCQGYSDYYGASGACTGSGVYDADYITYSGNAGYKNTCPSTCFFRHHSSYSSWPHGHGCIHTDNICLNSTGATADGTCSCHQRMCNAADQNCGYANTNPWIMCSNSTATYCYWGCLNNNTCRTGSPCSGQCQGGCNNNVYTNYSCMWWANGEYSCTQTTTSNCSDNQCNDIQGQWEQFCNQGYCTSSGCVRECIACETDQECNVNQGCIAIEDDMMKPG